MKLTVSLNGMSQTQIWVGLYAALESISAAISEAERTLQVEDGWSEDGGS